MPQLSQIGEIYASQLLWLAIVFLLIYLGIGKAMVPRIERTIDDRNARISGDLAAAEAARAQVLGFEETYETEVGAARGKATALTGDAKAKGAEAVAARVSAGDAASEARLGEAMTRIAGTKQEALAEIEATTVEAVEAIVTKLSGVAVDRAAAEAQVKAELAHG